MKEDWKKETIKTIEKMIKSYKEADKCGLSNNDFKNEIKALDHILSDYKRVLKENEEWDRRFCNLQNLYFKLQDESESKRKEYQETYKDVREELKELKKENELLRQQNISYKNNIHELKEVRNK